MNCLVFIRRPSGNAAQDMIAHTAPHKLKERERLRGIVSNLQSQNKLLKDAVRARKSKLEHTLQKIQQKAHQWKEVRSSCNIAIAFEKHTCITFICYEHFK